MGGFIGRIGGMLLAPRATLEGVRGGQPGGVNDLMLLLALQLVAVQLPELVRSLWFLFAVSYSGGISAFLNAVAQAILVPVAAIFIGALVVNLTTRGRPQSERNVDLAALSTVPLVCLGLLPPLAAGLSGWTPPPWAVIAVMAGGGIWYLALLVLAIRVARAPGQAAVREEGAP